MMNWLGAHGTNTVDTEGNAVLVSAETQGPFFIFPDTTPFMSAFGKDSDMVEACLDSSWLTGFATEVDIHNCMEVVPFQNAISSHHKRRR
jgi:hypothetical protein